MSLKVWLPLNGTLDNQGLDDVTFLDSPTFIEDGKIGEYSLASQINWFSVPSMAGKKQMSFAYWVKINSSTTTNWKDTFSWYSTDGNSSYRSRQEFYYFKEDGTGTTGVWYYNSSNSGYDKIKVGEWTHFTFTIDYEKGVSKFYINGNLWKTTSNINTTHYIQGTGSAFLLRESALDSHINDFRLYDHVLSPFEVKHISQGLILHYPLNNNGFGQENLLIDTLKDKDKTHTTYSIADYNFSEYLVEGEEYTITASVITSSEKTFVGIYHSGGSYSMSGWMKVNENGFYQKTFTATANMANRTQGIGYGFCRVYVSNNPSGGQSSYTLAGTANVNWIKIEKGTKATPWCPNEADKLYTILGLDNNIQYDASGYNHNLKNFNKFSFSSDTPKYNVSTELAGTSYGTHQYLFLNDNYQKELTVSCWIKRTSLENVARYISNSWVVLYLHSNFAPRISWKNSTGTSDVLNTWAPGEVIPINTWTHICFTIKNGIVKYYKNGTYISTSDRTQYGTLIHGSLSNGFGGESLTSKNWIGGLSDFRFYCTALSEEDILALYKNSVYIDNEGNLYGAELREV